MKILQASLEHLNQVAKLFDDYRQFYKQASDINGATEFLRHKIEQQESIIFIAQNENTILGRHMKHIFSQLHARIFLEDLKLQATFQSKEACLIYQALIRNSKYVNIENM